MARRRRMLEQGEPWEPEPEVDEKQNLGEPAPYPEDDDSPDSMFVRYVKAIAEERMDAFEPYRIEWLQNMLFLEGLQWYRYSPEAGTFLIEPSKPWKERPVWNLLRPFAKSFQAKLLKNAPVTKCVPASTDPRDVGAAEFADDVLKAKWIELDLSRKMEQAVAWLTVTGNAYLMPYWNTDTGNMVPLMAAAVGMKHDIETGEPMGEEMMSCPCGDDGEFLMDDDGNYDLDAEPAYYDQGEIGVRTLSPFQVLPNETAVDLDEVDSWIITEPLTLREIRRRWPEKGKQVPPEDTAEIERYDSQISIAQLAGADTHYVGPQFDRPDDGEAQRKAVVYHYYERKQVAFPHGRYWVTAGNVLLQGPEGLPDGLWPPVIHLKDVEKAGELLGSATMTPAIGPQRELNEYVAKHKEHFNLMVRGKWLVPKGAGIGKGTITTEPGQVIQHTPGYPPVQAELKPLPQTVFLFLEKLMEVIRTLTSMHEVSQGQVPEGVRSGRGLITLQEADDSDLGPLSRKLERGQAKTTWYLVQLLQNNYDEERMVRITGKHEQFQVRMFMGADLQAVVDVEPQVGSAFPWHHTARQAFLLDIMQSVPQLFLDPETGMFDFVRFGEAMPVGGEEAISNVADEHIGAAMREQDTYLGWDGNPETAMMLPQPQAWQNHFLHLKTHSRVLNSADFGEWPPENQEAFIRHFFAHRMVMQAEAAAQAQMAAEAEGGPQEPKPPSGGKGPPKGTPPNARPALYPSEARAGVS